MLPNSENSVIIKEKMQRRKVMKKLVRILLVALLFAVFIPSTVFADVSVEEYLENNIMNFWESNVRVQTSEAVKLRNMPCSEKTNSNSQVLVELPKGSYLMTTGIFQNDQRNLWYRVLYEGKTYYTYINEENFPANQIDWSDTGSMSFENLSVPETIVRGETDVAITGSVKSPYSVLKTVTAYLRDSEGDGILGSGKTENMYANTYEFNLAGSELVKLMKLGELEAGEYYIYFEAVMETGYVSSEPSLQEIRYRNSRIRSADFGFTVVDSHTCSYSPTTRLATHPHNYVGKCSVCGDTKELEGTGFFRTAEVVIKQATCTSEGIKAIVCDYGIGKKKCETVIKTEKIEMLEHTPTQTVLGTSCSVCGTVLSSTIKPHKHIYVRTGETEEAHPHRSIAECISCRKVSYLETENYNLVQQTTPSTCTVYGKVEMVCDVCGEVESSTLLPYADHSITVVNRTETYSGDQVCTVCEQVIYTGIELPPGAAHGCTFVQASEKESAHPHRTIFRCECGEMRFGAENITPVSETTPSTCIKEGSIVYKCEDCGIELSTEDLGLAPHTVSIVNQSETYTGDKVCTVCETVIEKGTMIAEEHVCNFESTGEYSNSHPHNEILRCSCGAETAGEPHFTTKKETNPSTCIAEGTEKEICEDCGYVVSEKTLPLSGHITEIRNQTETYTGDKVCTVCETVTEKGTTVKPGEYLKGDVNNDGTVDAKDATQILRASNGKASAIDSMDESERIARGDINGDGSVDAKDATQILRFVNGKPSVLG